MRSRLAASILALLFATPAISAAEDAGSGGGADAAAAPTTPTVDLINKTAADTNVFTFNYGVPKATALDLIGRLTR
jgi:hypothetical protein